MIWDYAEAFPFADMSGSWGRCCRISGESCGASIRSDRTGHVEQSATAHRSLTFCVGLITDPPYYDAVPYADLSDFFYVWLKRSIAFIHSPSLMHVSPQTT